MGVSPTVDHELPEILYNLSPAEEQERIAHRSFLFENVEFLTHVLTGEQLQRQRDLPVGCPQSTPEFLARNKGQSASECQYNVTHRPAGNPSPGAKCSCGDPLVGGTDPLETVLAAVLAGETDTVCERFFQKQAREVVVALREQYHDWDKIRQSSGEQIISILSEALPAHHITQEQIQDLQVALEIISESHYSDGTTLSTLGTPKYDYLAKFFTSLPNISETDSWWLLQVALDKPVWPSDPVIDRFLCSFGILSPNDLETETQRHGSIENELIDRLIPVFYRGIAAHAYAGGIDVCSDDCEIRKFLFTYRLREQQRAQSGPTVVDLFAGAGGLSCGLSRAGYEIRWAIDVEQDASATYRLNHPSVPHAHIFCDDIRDVTLSDEITKAVENPDMIVGGPPCQSLSLAGYRSRLAGDSEYTVLDDERTTLYTQYVDAIDTLRPKAIVMENVEGMVNEIGDTGVRVIDQVIESIESLDESGVGYTLDYKLVNMTELGIPQKRRRVFLIGLRNDVTNQREYGLSEVFKNLVKQETDQRTIQQGLSGLPRLRRGEGGPVVAGSLTGRRSEYVVENQLDKKTKLCYNHQARDHPMEKDRILFDKALSPGKTGWDVKYGGDQQYAKYIEYDVGTKENPRFKDKYRMLEWDQPSPTIVAHLAKDANAYVLPDFFTYVTKDSDREDNRRNRGITPREAARLQSFPDEYIFLGPFTSWFRQIGNAVPPLAGQEIGELLIPHLSPDQVYKNNIKTLNSSAADD